MDKNYEAFLNTYPLKSKDLARSAGVEVSYIRKLARALARRGVAMQADGYWRFKQDAIRLVRNRKSELIPFL